MGFVQPVWAVFTVQYEPSANVTRFVFKGLRMQKTARKCHDHIGRAW